MKKFKIITGTPGECENELNKLEGDVTINSVESKFDKYGVERMAIVVEKKQKNDLDLKKDPPPPPSPPPKRLI